MIYSDSWLYHTPESGFTSIAISSDGEYIVAGHSNFRVYLFHRSNSKPIWSYEAGHEITSVAISSSGNEIVAGSKDRRVYFFHNSAPIPLWSNSTGGDVLSVAISADGNYLAAGSEDGNIYIFNKSSSTPLWSNSTGVPVRTIAISSNGQYLVAEGDNFRLYLFNRTSPIPKLFFSTIDSIKSAAISSDGNYIVVGSIDENVYFFSKSSSTPIWTYTAYDEIHSVSISSDGSYIAAGGLAHSVYLFQNSSFTPIWIYRINSDTESVSISSSGDYLAVSGFDTTYCFHRSSQDPLWSSKGGHQTVISSDGNYIASASSLKVFLFNRENHLSIYDFQYYSMTVMIIGLSGLVIFLIIVGVRRRKLKTRGIRVFISHAIEDFNRYRIAEIAKYLESHPEINHVYYCEEDLTGNIDDWMKKTVPRCQLLIFFSTENSLNSEDCINELKIARKLNIQITPVLGVNLRWEDLEKLNVNRELGQEFDPLEFDKFKNNIYDYIIKFVQDLEKEILEKKKSKK